MPVHFLSAVFAALIRVPVTPFVLGCVCVFAVAVRAQQTTPSSDPVIFETKDFSCVLRISPGPTARLVPGKPLTVPLARGREYLVECEGGEEIPLKLYSRNHLESFRGPLPKAVAVYPIAVLPNVVKAVAAKKVIARVVKETRSLDCKIDEPKNKSEPRTTNSVQLTPVHPLVIPAGAAFDVLADRPLHCGDTNLIRVSYLGQQGWFRNRDFEFFYKDQPIGLFGPSRDLGCCWIE
jgi:hypothetical protein